MSRPQQRLKWILFAACALTLAAAVVAPTAMAQRLTLSEALATAYATNPRLHAARAELRAVNEGVPQALSNWRPEVTVSASVGKLTFDQQTSFLNAQQTITPNREEIEVTQPLYRGGRTVAETAAAENDVRAQRAALTSVEQSVLLDTVVAFMDVWRDEAVLELTRHNERVLARQLEATQDRFDVGELTRTDVAQAQTRLAVARADRVAAEGDLAASRAVFEEVVGLPAIGLSPPPTVEGLPMSQGETVAEAIASNPDVLSVTFAEKAAQNRVRQAVGELLPSLNLVASALRSEDATQRDSLNEQAQVRAEVSIPLYQRGAVSSRVREAKQVSSQRRLEIEERRRAVEQQAISAWEALQSAQAQIRSFESGVRSAEIALTGVREENLVGSRTILDVLDAEQELLDAQVNLVRSRRDEIVGAFQVIAVIGQLTATDLALPVEVYEPRTDYLKVRDRWFGLDAPGVQ